MTNMDWRGHTTLPAGEAARVVEVCSRCGHTEEAECHQWEYSAGRVESCTYKQHDFLEPDQLATTQAMLLEALGKLAKAQEALKAVEMFLDYLIEEQNGDHHIECAMSNHEEAHLGCTCSTSQAIDLHNEIAAARRRMVAAYNLSADELEEATTKAVGGETETEVMK